MDEELRRRLTDRAFLFDDPTAYLAGVDEALRAVGESNTRESQDVADPQPPTRRVLP